MFFKTVAAAPAELVTCPLVFSAPFASGGPVDMLPEPALAPAPALPPEARPRKRQATTQLGPPAGVTVESLLKKISELELCNLALRQNVTRLNQPIQRERVAHVAALGEAKKQNAELRATNEVLTGQLGGMTTQLQSAAAQMYEMTREMDNLRVYIVFLTSQLSGLLGPAQQLAVQPPVAQPHVDQQLAAQPPVAPEQAVFYVYLPYPGPGFPGAPPHS